jgi:Tol biopolymer transport system component
MSTDRLERDLTAWFGETAMPRTPDYVQEILEQTSRIQQRPRWTFLARWLPERAVARGAFVGRRVPWRAVALLALLGLLLAGLAAYVGSEPRLPAPFGPADNGLLAYSENGEVYTENLISGDRVRIAPGPERYTNPRWSLDGTRLVMLQDTPGGQHLVIADVSGSIVATSEPLPGIDPDSIAWSPDGRFIAIGSHGGTGPSLYLVDASDGTFRILPVDYWEYEVFWRPPAGRQLLFRNGFPDPGLSLYSLADGTSERVGPEHVDLASLRPMGWTPDGGSFLYQQDTGPAPGQVHVVDVETGRDRPLDVAYGHVSNDGTRVAGARPSDGFFCVVAVVGGHCVRVTSDTFDFDPDFGAGTQWAPNDAWLVVSNADGARTWLIDPNGRLPLVSLPGRGPVVLQRVAP